MYFLWYLLIGLAAGWIANLIVGLIGGVLGGWIFSWFGWIPVGTFGSFLTALAGAVILLWIVSMITRRKHVEQ